MLAFYFLAAIVIALGVLSLRGGFGFVRYVRHKLSAPNPEFTPFVSIIAPCRGLEAGLQENIEALFRQHYPNYEIVFVTDSAGDPAISLIEKIIGELAGHANARVIIAGAAV